MSQGIKKAALRREDREGALFLKGDSRAGQGDIKKDPSLRLPFFGEPKAPIFLRARKEKTSNKLSMHFRVDIFIERRDIFSGDDRDTDDSMPPPKRIGGASFSIVSPYRGEDEERFFALASPDPLSSLSSGLDHFLAEDYFSKKAAASRAGAPLPSYLDGRAIPLGCQKILAEGLSDRPFLFISSLAIRPEARGSGHGRRALGLILEEARGRFGVGASMLCADPIMEEGQLGLMKRARLIELYEEMGFCVSPKKEHYDPIFMLSDFTPPTLARPDCPPERGSGPTAQGACFWKAKGRP